MLTRDGEELYSANLGPVAVTQTERLFSPPPIDTPVDARFGEAIRLLGFDPTAKGREAGLTLVWQAIAPPSEDYTVCVHLLNPDGTCCVWQSDAMPQGGTYPTSRWLAGEVVIDSYGIVIPDDAAPGDYPLEVGLYLPETGERLPVVVDGVAVGERWGCAKIAAVSLNRIAN